MLNKCQYLRFRKKQGKTYCYCTKKRATIEFSCCSNCSNKEYKKVAKMTVKKPLSQCKKKHKTTIATSIPKEVKLKVWKRDNQECIFCHKKVPWNCANSHFVKRSHLGMGIEENIFTVCLLCHTNFDDTPKREFMLPIARNHLTSKYPYWNEDMLIYKKWGN